MRVHKVAMWSFFRRIRRSANVFVQIRNHIARKLHCLSCMCSFTATVCSSRGGALRHISLHGFGVVLVLHRVRVRVWFIRTSVVRSKTKQIGWKNTNIPTKAGERSMTRALYWQSPQSAQKLTASKSLPPLNLWQKFSLPALYKVTVSRLVMQRVRFKGDLDVNVRTYKPWCNLIASAVSFNLM